MKENHDIVKKIADFQESFFAGKTAELGEGFTRLADALSVWSADLSEDDQIRLIAILQPTLQAYADQDYLLVADLLEFELRTFAEKGGN